MAAFEIAPRVRPIEGLDTAAAIPHGGRSSVVPAMIAGAWMIVLVAQATGTATALHHHALIEGGPPLWVAIPLFLVAWQVMVVAMMLPASLPTIRVVEAAMVMLARPRRARAAFLGAFAVIWAVFGLLVFMGDFVLHHVVDTMPWLAARPWLIEAGVLALAGGYQFLPAKGRALAVCRHPLASLPGQSGTRLGLRHGLDCLGSSWALMLVMFAAGFASLWAMAALTVLMAYEATGRYGQRAATAAGIVLILAALSTLSGPLTGGP